MTTETCRCYALLSEDNPKRSKFVDTRGVIAFLYVMRVVVTVGVQGSVLKFYHVNRMQLLTRFLLQR